jgi:hypothetical protein
MTMRAARYERTGDRRGYRIVGRRCAEAIPRDNSIKTLSRHWSVAEIGD